MKLAKKMLACVVALVLISGFAVMAFAEEAAPVKFVLSTTGDAVVDGEIVVNVSVKNAKGIGTVELELAYDAEVFEFVKSEGAATMPFGVIATGNPSAGLVTANAMHQDTVTVEEGSYVDVTFKVLKAGEAKFDLKVNAVTDADDVAIATEADEVSITVTATEEPAETTEATTTDPTATTEATTGGNGGVPQTGDAGLAVAAGLVVLAGAAYVVTKKRK